MECLDIIYFEKNKFLEECICGICFNIMIDPVISCINGHSVGKKCMEQWIKQKQECPICKGKIDEVHEITVDCFCGGRKTEIISNPDKYMVANNIHLKNIISKFDVKCTNNDCNIKIKLSDLNSHLDNCEYVEMICKNGCDTTFIKKESENHENNCLHRQTTCNLCKTQIKIIELEQHNKICPKSNTNCVWCGNIMERCIYQDHLEKCPEMLICCDTINCGTHIKRKDIETHNEEFIKKHNILMKEFIRTRRYVYI
jgi:hypothetical protein